MGRRIIVGAALLCLLAGWGFFSCNNNLVAALDEKIVVEEGNPPIPGGDGVVTIVETRAGAIDVSWVKATDNATAQDLLEYKVIYSTEDNLGSIIAAEENGTVGMGWQVDVNEVTVSGLTILTKYYINVLVLDVAGNKTIYNTASGDTKNDTIDPVPGGQTGSENKTITLSTITDESITVSWEMASDDVTPLANLEYKVVYSEENNIGDVTAAETNGTIAADWTKNIDTYVVDGLTDNIMYYFNVLVQDEVEHIVIYTSNSETTLKHPRIFWVNAGTGVQAIKYTDIQAPYNVEEIVPKDDLFNPFAIAVDPVERKIYWTDDNPAGITVKRSDFNGQNIEELITEGLSMPYGIAVDYSEPNRYLYWTDIGNNKIYRADLPWSNSSTDTEDFFLLGIANIEAPMGIDVDINTDIFYWIELGATKKIRYAPATAPTTITDRISGMGYTDLHTPVDIAIDPINQMIYWTERGNALEIPPYPAKIQKINYITPEGSGVMDLINSELDMPTGITVSNGVLFWTDRGTDRIYKALDTIENDSASKYAQTIFGLVDPHGIQIY